MKLDINYELYKVFYHVAKTLSFSEAANELFISQSAVSQSIKILEKRLNQMLFLRNTKRVSLTKEGEMLFKHVEPAIHLIMRGENQLAGAGGGMQLRIAASDTICRYFLVPHLKSFHATYPEVHIKIINGTSLACAKLLESNQVDLIIANSPNQALNSNMNLQEVKNFRDVFIGNPSIFPLEGKTWSLSDLLTLPILMLTKLSTTSTFLHNLFLSHSLDLVPSIELSSNDLLIDLAKIGLGIAFVPDFCVENHMDDDLEVLKLAEAFPERRLVAAYNENIPLSEAGNFFIKQMVQA